MRPLAVAILVSSTIAAGAAGAQTAPTSASSPFARSRNVERGSGIHVVQGEPDARGRHHGRLRESADTAVLLGGGTLDSNPNPGFRITGTYAIDNRWGIEANGFYVASRSSSRSVTSTGQVDSIDLLLPFFDVTQNRENVTEISFSPDYRGTAQETLENSMGGGEFNVTWSLPPQNGWRVDLIGGLRYLQLRAAPDRGPWVASATAKLALGSMQQKVSINGYRESNDWSNFGAAQFFPGGYFALPTNSGDRSRNTFAVVPEIALSIGYRVTPAATVYVGYAYLYASDVVRPGDQIDRNVNPTYSLAYGGDPPVKPTGATHPAFSFNTTNFWAQSVTLGLSIRF